MFSSYTIIKKDCDLQRMQKNVVLVAIFLPWKMVGGINSFKNHDSYGFLKFKNWTLIQIQFGYLGQREI